MKKLQHPSSKLQRNPKLQAPKTEEISNLKSLTTLLPLLGERAGVRGNRVQESATV